MCVDNVVSVWTVCMAHEITIWGLIIFALWTMYPCFSVFIYNLKIVILYSYTVGCGITFTHEKKIVGTLSTVSTLCF